MIDTIVDTIMFSDPHHTSIRRSTTVVVLTVVTVINGVTPTASAV